ncbi:sorbitol-6-phosphate 2-dehydrogenase (glucitol-6-phosphate dehydrogenase) [Escherichia coli]|uniref:Sorbitol-6-phosphate 2-dehydrogenase (Glucitol-6-phosphate dehydrogenase) n=1 Tax=Escherichia coli TaxID=562 RepID=A0A2X1NHY5_ECOLX|nr:sorbitol-6-phosphate 2-dehydrogenase (glucitol-6-phosphate dehydrogenase) [Escherichia coli]
MNQVAVVIGGGQTLGAFLCHGLAPRGYASRLSIFRATSRKCGTRN